MFVLLMRSIVNRTLRLIRYPVGIFMLFILPAVIMSYKDYYRFYWHWNEVTLYFAGGAIVAGGLWVFMIFGQVSIAKTMEHELTHALFGFLTFNPPKQIEANDDGSGSMRFTGEANWVMALCPYFFPLLASFMILVGWVINAATGEVPVWVFGAIGAGVGYNIFSNIEQIHPGQTDFGVAGNFFSLIFLPAANLLGYAWIIAFVSMGSGGFGIFLRLVKDNVMRYGSYF